MPSLGTRAGSQRRASIYVMVLGTALLVTVLGLSALLNVQVKSAVQSGGADFAQARLLAQSAIDYGMSLTSSDPYWRDKRASGSWIAGMKAGNGTFDLSVVDPNDGDFTDSPTEAVLMTGTGRFGDAACALRVRLKPQVAPLDVLRTSVHVKNGLVIATNARITANDGPVSSNGTIQVDGGINGDVEAAAVVNPQKVTGTVTAPAPAKDAPPDAVIDYYMARATPIPYMNLIWKCVISNKRNPYGSLNADGLYSMDTGGANLNIGGMRLRGTLVVRTQGGRVRIDSSVLMEPYRADYPVLIVDGNLEIRIDPTTYLLELTWGTNFNPSGTPYNSQSDSDVWDVYPNTIAGLVHVRGNVDITANASLSGALLTDTMTDFSKQLTMTHIDTLWTNPPVGYATYALMPVAGSWQRISIPDAP